MSTWGDLEADRAFARANRSRRRASLMRMLRRACVECTRLAVYDRPGIGGAGLPGLREIPLTAIGGTTEPHRAAEFDSRFRPAAPTRGRWKRVWTAEQRGTVLPPISVVQVAEGYAVRDGHHRVSVALARGALTINAVVA